MAFSAGIVLVGLNLRPILAAVGPLLDVIQRDTGLDDGQAGLLTTIPVALMGFCMLGTRMFKARIGAHRGVALGLLLVSFASVLRWFSPSATLLLTTAIVGGIGIALVQALMPGFIRERAGRRGAPLMGVYSTAIMAGALMASATSPWLERLWGWSAAVGIWVLPGILGLVAWIIIVGGTREKVTTNASVRVHGSSRAWALLAFFGLGTGAYTLVLAWLPPFYTHLGWSAAAAGALLGAVTLAEVAAGVAVSVWVDRLPDRRPALFVALGALSTGLACLCLAPLATAWPAAVLAGVGIGALFPLSLIVAMDHADNGEQAGAVVGFVQGGGYLLAAVLPFIAGLMRQGMSDLTPAWALMAGLCLVLAFLAVRFRPGDKLSPIS
jgi:CP family cyanate transporter-like MFS transporter